MSPEHSDALLGGLWDCDLEVEPALESVTDMQDLLEELVCDLLED